MGKVTGFLEYERTAPVKEDAKSRLKHYNEFVHLYNAEQINREAARCMDCGVPFCQSGCPLGNVIPEFNDAVYQADWEEATSILLSTNNFPEFTGRICPAPCESACVLGINKSPVSIEEIEKHIIEMAFAKGYIKAEEPLIRTGKKVAIIGSGPAGLAAAAQLNKAGHEVTVFERDDTPGGLLNYGIPDFKLQKDVVTRRINLMEKEGIQFKCNANVGVNVELNTLLRDFQSIVLAGGSTIPRDLPITGRDAKGVHYAMDFLKQQNKRVRNFEVTQEAIMATGKDVIVIGGGDTGSDCVGTSNRQGAKSVTNFEIMPKPPVGRSASTPWPYWPLQLKTSTSHKEGCERDWLINTKEFIKDASGKLIALKTVKVEWKMVPGQRPELIEVEGSEQVWPCDLALLSLGFTGPEKTLSSQLGLEIDFRSNYKANNYQTNVPNVFTAGDMRRGQSLIVWAISEGREAARQVDIYLMGKSDLPTKEGGDLPGV